MNIGQKIKGKLAYWKRGVALFRYKPSNGADRPSGPPGYHYREISDPGQFEQYGIKIACTAEYVARFRRNEIFCILEKESRIVSYGWVNPNVEHYLGELDFTLRHSGTIEVLYNFETDHAYRGQGLYPHLLFKIGERNSKPKLIYALVDNAASIKGIKKASFEHLGNVYGFSKIKIRKLLQKTWQD